MKENIIYLDCYSGISGDMFIGALLDCGLSLSQLSEKISLLGLSGYHLEAEKISNYGITGTDFRIIAEKKQAFCNIMEIKSLVTESDLPAKVKERSLEIFNKLALVEARIHGIKVEEVHFHEIGALDSIIDIVGVVTALHLMDVNEIISSPLPLTRGFINIEHGKFPLPAPATAELLAAGKIPVYGSDIKGELVTPTGAVLVSVLANSFGKIPEMQIDSLGYGAGKNDPGIPNFLRIFKGKKEIAPESFCEKVDIIELNIDDLNPEITGYVMEKLFAEEALDVYFTPVQMKKNRPGIKLTVLCHPDKTSQLTETIFRETSTLGCRILTAEKLMLPRDFDEVETPWGIIRIKKVKSADCEANTTKYSPEYEDCMIIARRENIPLREVYMMAEKKYRDKIEKGDK